EFPGAILIDGDDFDAALRDTRRAIESGERAFFEAAFAHGPIAARPDVLLEEKRDLWRLWEVKSGMEVREEYLLDVAVQVFVLEGLEMRTRGGLLLVDRNTTAESETIFRRVECDAEVRERLPRVREAAGALTALVLRGERPDVELGRQCRGCDYLAACWPDIPSPSVLDLYQGRGGWRHVKRLLDMGITDLASVPPAAPLTRIQRRQVAASVSGRPVVDRGAHAALKRPIRYPLHFLDFEAARFPIPEFPGQHPYDLIPFQWSCHVEEKVGRPPVHHEFLWTRGGDPRRALAEALIQETRAEGSVVVYSGFEQDVIRSLVERFPDLRPSLESLTRRIFDLLPVLREHFYYPDFAGSFSIKSVLPVLVPGSGYEGMEIGDGLEAVWAYFRLTHEPLPEEERLSVARSLRAYCAKDSLALHDIYHALLRETGEPRD
ncbi:MAG: DUF2779 domain-containing protein, partial [Candidatus Eisenbacteria bacterium]